MRSTKEDVMTLRLSFVVLAVLGLAAPAARAAEKCGPHQHIAVEKDEDEGGTVKRCVCDEGWNAGGPGAPCKKAKEPGGKKAKK
jgi:hypothetical protein